MPSKKKSIFFRKVSNTVTLLLLLFIIATLFLLVTNFWKINELIRMKRFNNAGLTDNEINQIRQEYIDSKKEELEFKKYQFQNNCAQYGNSLDEDYLPEYWIQPGDSLLKIAQNQLGDVSKVNQIILLNKDRYPSLSMDNPFVEVGWKFFLPPEYINTFSGGLWETNIELAGISPDSGKWYYYFRPDGFGSITPDSKTLFPDGKDFLPGDCLKYIHDSNTPTRIFRVSSQEN